MILNVFYITYNYTCFVLRLKPRHEKKSKLVEILKQILSSKVWMIKEKMINEGDMIFFENLIKFDNKQSSYEFCLG